MLGVMPSTTKPSKFGQQQFHPWFEAGYRELDKAFKEGMVHGCLEGREGWVSNHGEGLCASPEVLTP
jgi:hypothetical protein